MKRGRDDEKRMEPMFPRLHVNDTEKGGPRAPPRNKMALYEHLTIPSMRYNSPKRNNGRSSSLVPSPLTTTGTTREQNTNVHLYRPQLHLAYDDIQLRNAEALTLNIQLAHVDSKKRQQEEDEFMVPVFSRAESEMCNETSHFGSNHQGLLITVIGEETNASNNSHPLSKQQIKDRDENHLRVSPSSKNPLVISMGGHQENQILEKIDVNQYVEKEDTDEGDDVSETSMVDSASEFDITADDVVDIIGRKHFWKARSEIVNQQRLFAVQVFELHRLLKVQKLIAASPNMLLEVGAVSLKVSSVPQRASENVVKVHKPKPTDKAHKPIDKAEGTAENVVKKVAAPVSSHQHPDQPAGYPPANMDPKMNPWGFHHQPPSPQWLVPVMSPSEGLVYKPFPAPGFTGPNPTAVNYVIPSPHYPQPMGGIPFGGPSYFPPYGMMPMMNPSMSGSTVVSVNPTRSEAQESSRPRELSEKEEDDPERREKRARVIKVVPHRSARESAARIFQYIQQEREANESSS